MNRTISINGNNTWDTWGVEFPDEYLDTLLLPPEAKEDIENESRAEPGIQITESEETCVPNYREFSIPVFITGSSQSDYLTKLSSFVKVLLSGTIALKVPAVGLVFHVKYRSCSKYGSYGTCRSRLTLKFKEPNPDNRDAIEE